jgi:ATP-dependent DNA helicase RecG
MRENGSPPPEFEFDAGRTFFRVTLPAHPEYLALTALQDFAYRKATGDDSGALASLQTAYEQQPHLASLALALVEELTAIGRLSTARGIVEGFPDPEDGGYARIVSAYAISLMDNGRIEEAKQALDRLPRLLPAESAFDAAIAERRAGREKRAHRYFGAAGDRVLNDVKALHEFAQCKMKLAGKRRNELAANARKRLLEEAQGYLERVLRMDAPPERHAWAWYDLGRVRRWLKRPRSEQIAAFRQAVAITPHQRQFKEALREAESEFS